MKAETVIVIPARFKSSRFPGKPLAEILGKPLIIHVIELCKKAIDPNFIYVATDDERIKKIVEKDGYNVVMTSSAHLTGTDRLAEVSNIIDAKIYINVQGDEPLVNPDDIKKIIQAKKDYPNYVIKGYTDIEESEDPSSLNIPKVISTEDNMMIYMSRNLLPASKDPKNLPKNYFKAVCIYAFDKQSLQKYFSFGRKSYSEKYEDIEILRFLEIGIKVKMVKTKGGSLAVDTPDDIIKVEKEMLLRKKKSNN